VPSNLVTVHAEEAHAGFSQPMMLSCFLFGAGVARKFELLQRALIQHLACAACSGTSQVHAPWLVPELTDCLACSNEHSSCIVLCARLIHMQD